MTIRGLNEDDFRRIIRSQLTPAKAISNPQHLRGREAKLRQIDRAFNSPGKHVFIFGDRGVGKTSLAQTAAVLHQSSDTDPIIIACDQGSSFFDLVRDMAKRCLPLRDLTAKRSGSTGFLLKIPAISYEVQDSIEKGIVPQIGSINDSINVMKYIAQYHAHDPVVIIDEFDQITDVNDRKYFADFIKQLADQDVGIRVIFCGIGKSLDDLIGSHLSTGRYLAPIELDRLSHDARWEIIDSAASELGVEFDREFLIRIGQISDGFPYYVHLMGEMIFWSMFDDNEDLISCKSRHFEAGVKGAVGEAQASLKFAYERATQKYSDDYQEVLWSVADDVMLRRQVTDIYERSYLWIMNQRPDRRFLEKKHFYSRMHNLCSDRHGHILRNTGAGWYEFEENIVRGYVRLRAEEHGIRLGKDHFAPA